MMAIFFLVVLLVSNELFERPLVLLRLWLEPESVIIHGCLSLVKSWFCQNLPSSVNG